MKNKADKTEDVFNYLSDNRHYIENNPSDYALREHARRIVDKLEDK